MSRRRAATTRLEPGEHSIDRNTPTERILNGRTVVALDWSLRLHNGRLLAGRRIQGRAAAEVRRTARAKATELLSSDGRVTTRCCSTSPCCKRGPRCDLLVVDWSKCGEYMQRKYGITTTGGRRRARRSRPDLIDPDYNSTSGESIRIIGISTITDDIRHGRVE